MQPGKYEYLRGLLNVTHAKHGKPDKPYILKGKEEQMREILALQNFKRMVSQAYVRGKVWRAKELRKSECLIVMLGIGASIII